MATKKNDEVVVNETVEEVIEEAVNEIAVAETSLEASAMPDDFDFDSMGFSDEELDGLTGLEGINASDIRVPYGKFWAVTKDGRIAGDLELPDGTVLKLQNGEVLKRLAILKAQTVRVMFPEPYRPANTYICRSLDGTHGADEETSEYAGRACASCEFSKYPEDGGAPKCREQILLLCTLDDSSMFHILVSGLSVGDWKKKFLSVEMMKHMAAVKKAMKGRGVMGALNIEASYGETKTEDFGMKPVIQFRVNKEQPLHPWPRIKANLDAFIAYKEFEKEAVETASTFARTEQSEYAEDGIGGENANMF